MTDGRVTARPGADPAAGPPRAPGDRRGRPSSRRATPTGCWLRRATWASARWVAFLEPMPDRLRDEEPAALRATAMRGRAAYGVKDSVRDVLPESVTEPFLDAIDRLLREIDRRGVDRAAAR